MKKIFLSITLLLSSLSLIAGDITSANYRYGYGMQFVPNTGKTWFWNPSPNPSFYCLYKLTKNGTNTIVTTILPIEGNLEIGKLYIFRLIFNLGFYINYETSPNPQSPFCIEYNNGFWNSILMPCPPLGYHDYDDYSKLYRTFGTDYKIQMLPNGPVAFLIKNYVDRYDGSRSNQQIINNLGPISQYLP